MNTLTSKSFIHPVTEAYADKISLLGGVVSDLNSVNNFVIELSKIIDPTLWVCWPLRSSQSIGSGTIAPSLGLLGDFPGTLINGPIWGDSGMTTINGSFQRINTNINFAHNANSTLVFVGQLSATTSTGRRIFGNPGFNRTGLYTLCTSSTANSNRLSAWAGEGPVVNFDTLDLSLNQNYFAAALNTSSTTNNWLAVRNGSSGTASFSNPAESYNLSILAGQTAADYWTGVSSFAAYFNTTLSSVQLEVLRNLLKNTLGKGLGLP